LFFVAISAKEKEKGQRRRDWRFAHFRTLSGAISLDEMARFSIIAPNRKEIVPKQITSIEFDQLLQVAGRFPAGAGIEDITKQLEAPIARRTLQRRLALLVAQGRLTLEGGARASRYQLPDHMPEKESLSYTFRVAESSPMERSYSYEAEDIRHAVSAAVQNRKPVGYNRAFLESYHPNETYYLPAALRQRLAAVGNSLSGDQPAGTHARKVMDRLLIDLSWNSSRLEGNTYSLLETERLLQMGENADGRSTREAQMILNHKAAIELLVDQADEIGFNRYTILNLHAALAESLLSDPGACGRLRSIPVGIGGSVFHPLQVPQVIEECFHQILQTASAINDPFEQSFFAMVHLPYLQPFEDVNKRVSRLAANIPFVRNNLSPLSFVDVPESDYLDGILGVYELNRVELLRDVFAWAYERSCARYAAVRHTLGDPDPFRMRHRGLIMEMVGEVIRRGMDKKAAVKFILLSAETKASGEDRAQLVTVAETELTSLHEGNFARYRVRPSEYYAWRQVWR